MIQTFHFTVPHGEHPPDPLIATLQAKLAALARIYPALQQMTVQASDGLLHMHLQCQGRDRWYLSSAARKIAANMVGRIKLDTATVTLVGIQGHRDRRSITKEQGRPGPDSTKAARDATRQRHRDHVNDLQSAAQTPAAPS